VLRARSIESRFEVLHATGLTALVGRKEECERLLRRWARAKTGEGQVVLIAGEAGIGKSRLTAALLETSLGSSTRAYAICAPRSIRTARFIRSLAKWNEQPGFYTHRKRSSTSLTRCWHRPRPPNRTPPCLQRCCYYQMTATILLDLEPPNVVRSRGSSHIPNASAGAAKTAADDFRGLALD